jgi:uncharacterized membrane protein (DUF2068 family)
MRDWNLRTCARRGHATYTPTGDGIENQLRERLRTDTAQGEAWRCLRCGVFVPGPAKSSGPADAAPEVLRGKALRDHFILRVLAVERIVRGVVIALIAWGVWEFGTHLNSLQDVLNRNMSFLDPVARHYGSDLETMPIVLRIRKFFDYNPHSIHIVAILLGAYALLETVEGVGLWMAKRWGEYLTAVGTSIFLPLEIWDGYTKIHEHKSWILAACTFTINVAAVLYLLLTKRLFGIRGGGAAFEAKKHADSLLTVELAACGHVPPTRSEERAAERAADEVARETLEEAKEAREAEKTTSGAVSEAESPAGPA